MSSSNAFLNLTETLDTLDDYVGVSDDFDSTEIESVIVGFSNDPKFRYALIEWVAKSHHNTIKRKRKQVVQKALGFKDVRQVERLLKQYKAGDLHEECGTTAICLASTSERTPTNKSIMGFAANPGTAVLPKCSIRVTRSPSKTAWIRADSCSNRSIQFGSYSVMTISSILQLMHGN
ncbi:hypothetical protein [Phormidium sp. FACHB-592]|uniref:hypothetical protein n=1 Tax=Phormidium sp. FACHB-592 TaxID=2692850 RepID=UPI001F555B38|nr:hypothetical protein [Phormidium sp. FACHB-592]